jgi:hypothetical protein
MQHQLVLQFRRTSFEAPGLVDGLEAKLKETLGDTVEMDGHDIGTRDVSVFILTLDPASTFRKAKPVLEGLKLLDWTTAAHRVVGGAQFKVIWPLRVRRKFTLGR